MAKLNSILTARYRKDWNFDSCCEIAIDYANSRIKQSYADYFHDIYNETIVTDVCFLRTVPNSSAHSVALAYLNI